MLDITYGGAFLAGLLSFFSPCILPMVPFYLSYMAGLSVREISDGGSVTFGARGRLIGQALAFALGVTTIFFLLGLGATAIGSVFLEWQTGLSQIAAGLLILFGLHFLGIVRFAFLFREARTQSRSDPRTVLGAYAMGLAFGFGWTPCVGPALAAILMVAAGMDDLWRGGTLLLVYGLAMTLPFVLAAAFAAHFLGWVARHRSALGHVEKAMGLMLILFGILIATNKVSMIADWLIRTFDWSVTLT
jgi:cytochrome c-type biogenesis protein